MMPLPRLQVLRETYCSQQVVDTAIGYVEAHRPELIEKLMEDEHWRQQDYSEAGLGHPRILNRAESGDSDVPDRPTLHCSRCPESFFDFGVWTSAACGYSERRGLTFATDP
jgi:hypothetical protein